MKGEIMHRQHIRRTCGGVKAGKPLTCSDNWPDAWPYARRAHPAPACTRSVPNPWGLTTHELAGEISRCRADGWQAWELRVVFGRWVR